MTSLKYIATSALALLISTSLSAQPQPLPPGAMNQTEGGGNTERTQNQRRAQPRAESPAPRDANGRAVLGSVPGQVGMWEGFGTRPMIHFFDTIPEGSIAAYTPYEDVLKMSPDERFEKIKLSEVPFQPWAKALFEARTRTRFEPYTRCKPSAGPRGVATAYGTQFVEFPDNQKIYIFPTGGPRHFRVIYMDGREHPADLKPTYHGHSIGHWEGDTLVVDTVGFNEKMWFDDLGSPHTTKLHMTERFTRVSLERLRYEFTIDDPGAYTAPWSSGFYMTWGEGESFQFVCQDANLAYDLMLGTEYSEMDRRQSIFP